MKKIPLVTSAIVALSASTMADIIGGEVSIGLFNHNPSGWIQYPVNSSDINKIDLDKDLNLNTKSEIYIRAKVEHPVPLIPNIKVAYTKINSKGNAISSKDFIFGNETFVANSTITTDMMFDSFDATLYYEVVDIGFDADIGVTFRYIDEYTNLYATSKSYASPIQQKNTISTIIPMFYGSTIIPLPLLDNLSIEAEGNFITYDSNTIYDIQANVRYEFFMGFGVKAGYRVKKYKLSDTDDSSTDIDIEGFFIGTVWDF